MLLGLPAIKQLDVGGLNKMKKKLTLEELQFIKKVYQDILKGVAGRRDINDSYYLLTQDNVSEDFRMHTIVKFMENDYQDVYRTTATLEEIKGLAK